MRFKPEKLQEIIQDKPYIKTYVRGRKKQPVGVLVAIKNDNKVHIGWSKCNIKLDRFDRQFGFYLAAVRSLSKKIVLKGKTCQHKEILPTTVQKYLPKFVERANKFFFKKKR